MSITLEKSTLALTSTRETLTAALATAAPPIKSGKHVHRVLSNVLIDVADGQVTLSTTDYDSAVTISLEAQGHGKHRFLIPHTAFLKILNAATKGMPRREANTAQVTIHIVDDTPVVNCAGYSLPLPTIGKLEDFPAIPQSPAATHIVERAAFTELINRTKIAASHDELLPLFCALQISMADGILTSTATDRYRIATGSIATTGDDAPTMLVPAQRLAELLKHLAHTDTLAIGASATHMSISSGTVTATIQLAEGDFPSLSKLLEIPADANSATLDRKALALATTRTGAIMTAAAEPNTAARIRINAHSVTVIPGLTYETLADAPPLEATTTADEPTTLGINPTYLNAALSVFGGDNITLTYTAPGKPIQISDPDASSAYTHVIMLMRLPS